jgi:hypothetical protein
MRVRKTLTMIELRRDREDLKIFVSPRCKDLDLGTRLLKLLPEFRECTKVHLGDGEHCSFWFDHWLGPRPLAELFPALLTHCRRPNVTHPHLLR